MYPWKEGRGGGGGEGGGNLIPGPERVRYVIATCIVQRLVM